MKKLSYIAGIMAVVAMSATALVASAQTSVVPINASGTGTTTTGGLVPPSTVTLPTTSSPILSTANQPILDIGTGGTVLLRGTLASVSAGVITVNSWGGTWTVNVPSSAEILPAAANNDITTFSVGDFVGVHGTISQSGNWTVNADIVRDWTYKAVITAQRQTNKTTGQGIIQGGAQNFVGTASNVSASGLTLTVNNGTVYTVNVPSGAEVVNLTWLTLPLTSVQSGDTVGVWGVNASGTITAQIVRDRTITK